MLRLLEPMVIYQKGDVEDSFKAGGPPSYSSFSHSRGYRSILRAFCAQRAGSHNSSPRNVRPVLTIPAEETLEFQLQTQKAHPLRGRLFVE